MPDRHHKTDKLGIPGELHIFIRNQDLTVDFHRR